MGYKIGYIDEDPAQVTKYERQLRKNFEVVGYDIPKGLPLEDLVNQVYDSGVDLLMIDYLMTDKGILTYNGDKVARAYQEVKPHFPMIIFTNEEGQAFPHVDDVNIIYDKADIKDLDKFSSILTKNIEAYKNFVSKKKDIINQLLEKGEKGGLTVEEKHTLLQSQIELANLDKRSSEVPFQLLLDGDKVDQLSKTTKEAEEFLESLIKKDKK